jgi:hypothetical protein
MAANKQYWNLEMNYSDDFEFRKSISLNITLTRMLYKELPPEKKSVFDLHDSFSGSVRTEFLESPYELLNEYYLANKNKYIRLKDDKNHIKPIPHYQCPLCLKDIGKTDIAWERHVGPERCPWYEILVYYLEHIIRK